MDQNYSEDIKNKGHYILISRAIYRESIVIANTYVLNVRAPNFIKQTVMDTKGQMGPNRIVVSDSILHSNLWIGHPIEKKINKETSELNCTIGQRGLTDIHKTFHLKEAQSPFFSVTYDFLRTDHTPDHKSSLKKYKRINNLLCYQITVQENYKPKSKKTFKTTQIHGD